MSITIRNMSNHVFGCVCIDFEELADVVLEVGDGADGSKEESKVCVLGNSLFAFVSSGRPYPMFGSSVIALDEALLGNNGSCRFSEVCQIHLFR